METYQIIILGTLSGFALFIGLPFATFQNISQNKKGFLNAIAIGILLIILVVIFDHSWEHISLSLHSFGHSLSLNNVFYNIFILFGGISMGFLGLTFYERFY